jgi:RNA polymerase sigma-70 factor (ECF subfamily)
MMPPDLTALVTAAKSGDRSAFDELVQATYADMYTLAYRLTGNEEDAQDVVQDAYLRAYRGIKRFRGDARFTTWMYRITANCASTQLAKRSRSRHEDLDEDVDDIDTRADHNPELRAEAAFDRDRVVRALQELPPRLRAVVVLRDVYDLPHESIADELGITEAAAKVRLHRARRKLRERLFPVRSEDSLPEDTDGDARAV